SPLRSAAATCQRAPHTPDCAPASPAPLTSAPHWPVCAAYRKRSPRPSPLMSIRRVACGRASSAVTCSAVAGSLRGLEDDWFALDGSTTTGVLRFVGGFAIGF